MTERSPFHRRKIVAAVISIAVLSSVPLHAQVTDRWTCQIDLHQGDTGTFDVARSSGTITGTLNVRRGDAAPVSTTIEGTWSGDAISFTRTLSPTSSQPFAGVALRTGSRGVRMAGRFASEFSGIWSADCTLAGGGSRGRGGQPGPPGPNLSIRIDPFKPTERDRVKFIADASHPEGVEEVTIHVNGQAAQTCRTTHCEFVGGPYPAGTIRWRVSARARNGGVQDGQEREVTIASAAAPPPAATGACSISGAATGPSANVAKEFTLFLYGPNDAKLLRASSRIVSGRFTFTNLPDGRYVLVADTKGDLPVRVVPPRRAVTCSGAALTGIDFEFR